MNRDAKIWLAKNIKMNKDYRNVLKISESDMITLMTNQSNLVYYDNHYSFLRENLNEIYVQASYGTCIQANYIAFQNPDYSNKIFFGFIDDVIYENEHTTRIKFTIDVWTTWYSYWDAKACFVVREHVQDDTLGANTVPEGLETGDYIVNSHLSDSYNNVTTIVYGSNVDVSDVTYTYGNVYTGVPSAVTYFHRSQMVDPAGATLHDSVAHDLDILKANGKLEEMRCLFIVPTWILGSSAQAFRIAGSDDPEHFNLGISRIASLNGYTPVNKKMLTFPYCYILLTNGAGESAIYHQELWNLNSNNEMILDVEGVLCPGCSIRAYPLNYNGDGVGIDYGLTLGKFPQINWATDQYTNWLTQNGTNMLLSAASGAVALGAGIASANPVAIAGGTISIANTLNKYHQAKFTPSQIGGQANAGDIQYAMGANRFHCYRMTIKQEFARIIDKYFTVQGYKVNTVKIPNMSHRQNYNYVQIADGEKTAYSNNYNNICPPPKDLDLINSLFVKGVTMWNNHANLGDYSVSNNITS